MYVHIRVPRTHTHIYIYIYTLALLSTRNKLESDTRMVLALAPVIHRYTQFNYTIVGAGFHNTAQISSRQFVYLCITDILEPPSPPHPRLHLHGIATAAEHK